MNGIAGHAMAGHMVALTAIEYRMLVELSATAGRVPVCDYLLQRVWGVDKEGGDLRDMHAVLSSLRFKPGGDADGPGCPGSTWRGMQCHRPAIESLCP